MICRCEETDGDGNSVHCPEHDGAFERRNRMVRQINRVERRQRLRDAHEFGYVDLGGDAGEPAPWRW